MPPARGEPPSDGPFRGRDRPLHPPCSRGAAGGAGRAAEVAPELPPRPRGLVPAPRDAREGRPIGRRPGDAAQGARELRPLPRDDRARVDVVAAEDPREPPERLPEGLSARAAERHPRTVARELRGPLVGDAAEPRRGAGSVAEPGGAAPRGCRARRRRDRRARARRPRRRHPAQPPRAGLEHGRRADRALARRGAHALGAGDAARGRIAQGRVS